MRPALRPPMVLDAFLAWENRPELRCGSGDFYPVAMTGDSAGHAILQHKMITALTNRLRGRPWPVPGSESEAAAAGDIEMLPPAFYEGTAWTRPDKAASLS